MSLLTWSIFYWMPVPIIENSSIRVWGTGSGLLLIPNAVSSDSEGNVYVVGYASDRIQKFTGNGTFITTWGSFGTLPGQFDRPFDIAVDSEGSNVYVADTLNNRIQKFPSSLI